MKTKMNFFVICIGFVTFYLVHLLKSFVLYFIPRRFRWKKEIIGKRILITGAGNGLGRQIAIQFSKHPVCIILLDIDKTALQETEKLVICHTTVFAYQCDVSDRKMVHEVASKIKKEVGDVDILINNAGIAYGKHLLELSEEQIVKTMNVNTLAHFWMCQAFLPSMMARNSGHVVSVVSVMGKTGGPQLTDYCASKFAALGFAESLEMELRNQKLERIKVTIVCPWVIDTGLFEGVQSRMLHILRAEYVAEEIVAGVLEEQEIIYLPHYLKYLVMVKDFTPRWLLTWFHDKTGDLNTMEKFTGRNVKGSIVETDKRLTVHNG